MSGLIEVLFYYWLPLIFIAVESYLIGGVNASIIVTKIFKSGEDIRKMGSGNAGFTNVLRTFGKKLAVWTFIIDFLKGFLSVAFAQIIINFFNVSGVEFPILTLAKYLACTMCVIGHMYPCFFKFKGGKGILATWAAMFLVDYRVAIVLISVFLIVLVFTKIVSASSVCAAISYPIASFCSSYFWVYKQTHNFYDVFVPVFFSLIISAVVIFKHKENIKRILNKSEKKISVGK
ncbi:MAG: glycerol-3-phosphate 1-O-acyltransferase PlsY [Clostridia bacterium]|nr:glycerol-3-phosphate 1-O-acyltransferase PlsY [Clostridia bacterium]